MTTNELRKGTMVMLRNGWEARIEDNKKGNIRMATVWGYCTEMGSIYSYDIVKVLSGPFAGQKVEYTPSQEKCKKQVENIFGR